MQIQYSPILKAKQGEFRAIREMQSSERARLLPLIDFCLPSETSSKSDVEQILGTVRKLTRSNLPELFCIDAFSFLPNATVSGGEHVLNFIYSAIRSEGLYPIPVIGYDRWVSPTYQLAVAGIGLGPQGRIALRLDSSVFDDVYEPAIILDRLNAMLEAVNAEPERTLVFIDCEDISSPSSSLPDLLSNCENVLNIIAPLNFAAIVIAGASIPGQVSDAVPERDSSSFLLRKEQVVWRSLRGMYPHLPIVPGDYGVRGPVAYDGPNPNINGKIRYTTDRQFFIARGHSKALDGGFWVQMRQLANVVVRSPNFRGTAFSWGDQQLAIAASGGFTGNPTKWIEIDTSHHISAVLEEVLEFERSMAWAKAALV